MSISSWITNSISFPCARLGRRLLFQQLSDVTADKYDAPLVVRFHYPCNSLNKGTFFGIDYLLHAWTCFIHWTTAILTIIITWSWGWTKSSLRMLRRPSCVPYCAGLVLVYVVPGWLPRLVCFSPNGICLLNSMYDGCFVCWNEEWSIWAARRNAAHEEVCLISIQVWGCNYHTSFTLGTVQVHESGEREVSSDQSNTDAPYITQQLCGYEGQKLYNTSPMPTAPRGKWMDACRGRVIQCLYKPAPVAVLELIQCGLHHARRTTSHALLPANATILIAATCLTTGW